MHSYKCITRMIYIYIYITYVQFLTFSQDFLRKILPGNPFYSDSVADSTLFCFIFVIFFLNLFIWEREQAHKQREAQREKQAQSQDPRITT